MQIELRQLHKRLGATIIYVTHDQREALTMSDRVAILKDGRLVQIDTARAAARPSGEFLRRELHRRGQPAAGRAASMPAALRSAGAVLRSAPADPARRAS